MELVRAILGLLLGLFFLSLILRLAYPIIMFLGILFLFTLARGVVLNRSYQREFDRCREFDENRSTRQSTTRPTGSRQSDVFDAEYTEEEIE